MNSKVTFIKEQKAERQSFDEIAEFFNLQSNNFQ